MVFYEGLLMVVTGPSGTGKGTIIKKLHEINKNFEISVSATTREPRKDEINKVDYYFESSEKFLEMIKNDELLEWVNYCSNYYGTPKKNIEDLLKKGKDVILEIEVFGALNIKKKYPNSILVFISPPSFTELKDRIKKRGTENNEKIMKRLEKAKKETRKIYDFEYVIVNEDIDNAAIQINSILISEKLKNDRNKVLIENLVYSMEKGDVSL